MNTRIQCSFWSMLTTKVNGCGHFISNTWWTVYFSALLHAASFQFCLVNWLMANTLRNILITRSYLCKYSIQFILLYKYLSISASVYIKLFQIRITSGVEYSSPSEIRIGLFKYIERLRNWNQKLKLKSKIKIQNSDFGGNFMYAISFFSVKRLLFVQK